MKTIFITIFSSFITMMLFAQKTGTFTDKRDGKTYKTIKLGNQIWMAENLAFKANGGCWAYDNNQENVKIYGYLYNWVTAQNVCPVGWTLPTEVDFDMLLKKYNVRSAYDVTMEESEKDYIKFINEDSKGFNPLFSGVYNLGEKFIGKGESAGFWSIQYNNKTAHLSIEYAYGYHVIRLISGGSSSNGMSVRCIKK